ncbi:BTAD domain-containing putative transcriptional regulator [Streptomyces sp. NPDC047042]|uniref:AfsR/SARP family transcriptional regulator n=1 Tax=Streptomyces sp. NPDC047042 TaxID=3154807 RepID=UPI00340D2385
MGLEIRLLGPVELRANQYADPLGSAKERLLVAALAFEAGRPVSLDALIHRLWDENPPAQPRASLHSYAARIRRRLRALDSAARLVQQAHTYSLKVPPGQVDYHRFQQLTVQARTLSDSGDDRQALRLLRDAGALWRGEPLAGLPGLWAEHLRGVLGQRHLSAQLFRVDLELREGRYAELVPDLTALLEEHPTDELLAGRLMTATYGSGRQADALRVFEGVRRRLRDDLGADPGAALSRLHGLVLNGAPVHTFLPRPEAAVTAGAAATAPRALPGHAELVGREAELAAIVQSASPPRTVSAGSAGSVGPPGSAVPAAGRNVIALQTVSGMAGVGKTLIALHAARQLAPLYPDGAVHLDLRAHAPGQEALTTEAALSSLIRAFGVPAKDLPQDPHELAHLWNSLLGDRRAIVILDDAAGPEQLRPLLPGSSPSLVIVTSRRRLTGLPGIRAIQLDVLPAKDAVALFRSVAGEERTRQTNEVADIVRLTGYLPLAIELAAGRLASRPSWTTAHLLRRLTHGQGRLNEIRDGSRGGIATAFEVSYRTLTSEEQTIFRFIGLRFGPDIDAYTLAALTGLPHDATENVLEVLLDAHLIREPAPERYTLHDLLGEYARSLVMSEESESARERAASRTISFYVQASDAADRMIQPRALRPHRPLPPPEYPVPPWDDPKSARRWLLAERTALLAAERHCRATGRLREAALLAGALAGFLDEEGYSADARRMHASAVEHWHAVGERRFEVHALIDLGNALSHCGRYDEARTAHRRALRGAEETGDTEARAEALHQLGVLHWNLGRLTEALRFQLDTLRLRLASGDHWQIARSRNNIGITHLYLGNFEESRKNFHAALTDFRRSADGREYAHVLNNLSDLHMKMGEPDTARRILEEALELLSETGSPAESAIIQVNLANTMNSPDELSAMLDLYQDSLATFRRLTDRRNASDTLHAMGLALHAAGRYEEAATRQRHALDLARSVGAAHEQAQALHALGRAESELGLEGPAAAHIAEAIEIADRTGAAREASQARASLAGLRTESALRQTSTRPGTR